MSEPSGDGSLDHSTLATNGMIVRGLQVALTNTQGDLEAVPKHLAMVLETRAWRAWKTVHGQTFTPKDFRKFVEDPRPDGCQFPLGKLETLVYESGDAKLKEAYQEATVGKQGANPGEVRNPHGRAGKPEEEINRSNGTVNFPDTEAAPATIPFASPGPRDRKPEEVESEDVPRGNTVPYAHRRLRREIEKNGRHDLEPLYRRLLAGEVSAHRAMIEAGIKLSSITVLDDPEAAARVLARHFRGERLDALIRHLAAHAAAPSDGDAEGGP